jgi:hypothetical protein
VPKTGGARKPMLEHVVRKPQTAPKATRATGAGRRPKAASAHKARRAVRAK